MSKHLSRADLQAFAVPAPPARALPNRAERTSGLPPRPFLAISPPFSRLSRARLGFVMLAVVVSLLALLNLGAAS